MSLRKELDDIHQNYLDELNSIKEFVKNTEKNLSRKTRNIKLNEKEKQEVSLFVNAIINKTGNANELVSKKVARCLLATLTPIKHETFLAEMTLSYLISFQEGFIKDYIMSIFTHNKSILKSSKKITYEEALSYESFESLKLYMAQKEIESLGYGSIDDVEEYISKKFGIDISAFEKWKDIRLGFTVCSKAHRRYAAPGARLRVAAKSGVCLHNCTMFFDLFYAENPLGERDFQIF